MAALLSACATTSQRGQALDNNLKAYEKAIRWGDFGAAMQFLHPEHLPRPREIKLMMQRFE